MYYIGNSSINYADCVNLESRNRRSKCNAPSVSVVQHEKNQPVSDFPWLGSVLYTLLLGTDRKGIWPIHNLPPTVAQA